MSSTFPRAVRIVLSVRPVLKRAGLPVEDCLPWDEARLDSFGIMDDVPLPEPQSFGVLGRGRGVAGAGGVAGTSPGRARGHHMRPGDSGSALSCRSYHSANRLHSLNLKPHGGEGALTVCHGEHTASISTGVREPGVLVRVGPVECRLDNPAGATGRGDVP